MQQETREFGNETRSWDIPSSLPGDMKNMPRTKS